MVDCRTCKHCYKIWEEFTGEDRYLIVCLAKRIFVDWEFAITGECERYDDVDGYNSA